MYRVIVQGPPIFSEIKAALGAAKIRIERFEHHPSPYSCEFHFIDAYGSGLQVVFEQLKSEHKIEDYKIESRP